MRFSAQKRDMERLPAVSGTFYPESKSQLNSELKKLFGNVSEQSTEGTIRAIISPHAGYSFSGAIAASAYSSLPETFDYDNVILIGSSHRVSFPGASVFPEGHYVTPLGRIKVNETISGEIIKNSELFSYLPQAHESEHCLEVQLPFLQFRYGNQVPIVPVIIGTTNIEICKQIAQSLKPYFNSRNLFIISSDFSHYPPYNIANNIDLETLSILMAGNPTKFIQYLKDEKREKIEGLATRMCGWTAGLVLLYLFENEKELEFKHIAYKNSGDTPFGDRSGVVGYHSIILRGLLKPKMEIDDQSETGFSLSTGDQRYLLETSRNNIRSKLYENRSIDIDKTRLSEKLKSPLGAFVTIYLDGKLKGCIGRFDPEEPLVEVVKQMSASAAFNDSRFSPLTKEEFDRMSIEISVLSPMRQISDSDEIVLGKHGVYIKSGARSGTFLPQVAKGKDWTVEDFLGYLSRDKAGLGWDGWKTSEIFVYEACIFSESKV